MRPARWVGERGWRMVCRLSGVPTHPEPKAERPGASEQGIRRPGAQQYAPRT